MVQPLEVHFTDLLQMTCPVRIGKVLLCMYLTFWIVVLGS